MSHSAGPSENHRDEESEDRIRQSPSKKPRLSVDETAPDTVHTTTATTAPRRAAQACLRCRKQKLRCLGGWPCARCIKANRECDFGKPGQHPIAAGGGGSDADPEGASARLQHLESSVADLLAGLSRSGAGAGSGTGQGVQDGWLGRQETRILPQVPVGTPDPGLAHRSYSSTSLHGPAGLSPLTDWSSSTHARARKPDAAEAAGEQSIEDNGNRVDAEERLASATREGFEPPFRALVYQPSVWENRERSRRSSPQRAELHVPQLRLAHGRGAEGHDPVSAGIVDAHTAKELETFYAIHCHPFLPIIEHTPEQTPYGPALHSAVLAIAARFYSMFHRRPTSPPPRCTLDADVPARLAELAERHLARTLLQKQHSLADVQAILLLAAWGLQSGGRGPDAWVLTGHAARVARRLGFHKLIRQAVDASAEGAGGIDSARFQQILPQWRTCLAWYSFDSFLSLGFGRPQSTQLDSVEETAFLETRLSQPIPRPGSAACTAFYGDTYLAGLAELAHIARRLVRWTEEENTHAPSEAKGDRVTLMLEDLNGRLDDWSRKWIWSGSRYSLYLGSEARIVRLQAEHLRLSINSMALRASTSTSAPSSDEKLSACLRKALNAATSTIQTHFESSQTDLFLSFATDYLTITLAQAAVFLIRLTKAPAQVQRIISLDPSVVAHYLTRSVDLLQQGDVSETRLSSYLARTVREIARAAGITLRPDDLPANERPPAPASAPLTDDHTVAIEGGPDEAPVPPLTSLFDADAFWAGHDQFDLGHFLGLSGETHGWPGTSGGGAEAGSSTELLESFANSWDTAFGANGF